MSMHLTIVAVFWSVVVIALVSVGLIRRRRRRAAAADQWGSGDLSAKSTRSKEEK
jgi:hypothetical protein